MINFNTTKNNEKTQKEDHHPAGIFVKNRKFGKPEKSEFFRPFLELKKKKLLFYRPYF